MTQFISSQETCQELFYPMMLKVMTDEETRRYHRKKLFELSLKSLGQIPKLEEPTYEQKAWFVRKMKAPPSAWRSSV